MRNFSNFLDGYFEYARDGFCPDQFHYWTGLSILSGVLERRISLKQGLINHYPNIYALLVSHPSVGKSTAIERGVDLIEEFRVRYNPDFKIIPSQATEAALIDMMKIRNAIQIGPKIIQYSSGYFYASEASASAFKNEHGDFNATLTAFYDCPSIFRKKLKGESEITEIPFISFSVLAGTTFDFLKRLVNEDSVMGGLASRFIYVISKDRKVSDPTWHLEVHRDEKMRQALIADLSEIHKLIGPMKPTPGFVELWQQWKPEFDQYIIDLNSPRMESILARKATNLIKVCMLLSASEGNSMELNERHWEKGLALINDVTKDNAYVISSAIMAKSDTQSGFNQLILQTVFRNGGKMETQALKSIIVRQGCDPAKYDPTIKFLYESGKIRIEGTIVKLLTNPEADL